MRGAAAVHRESGESLFEGKRRRSKILDRALDHIDRRVDERGRVPIDGGLFPLAERIRRPQHPPDDRSTVRVRGAEHQPVARQAELAFALPVDGIGYVRGETEYIGRDNDRGGSDSSRKASAFT